MRVLGFFFSLLIFTTEAFAQRIEYDKTGNRRLAVYLPEGYDESTENFKVVYFYDGQAGFTNNPFSWKIHDKITALITERKIEKIVAVGIYTEADRTDDLVPYYDPHVAETWGPYKAQGDKFDNIVIETILPYIESKYKVHTEGKNKALIGMSFGGLHALYSGINNPDAFGMVAGISPSLWIDNYHFIKDARKASVGPAIWFDIGTAEWNDYVPAIEAFTESGYEYGKNLFYFEEEGATHQSKFWVPRVEFPLILFAGTLNPEIEAVKIFVEVIASSDSKKDYLRLNPVATRADGIKYSLASQATYEVADLETGSVNPDGSFELKNNFDMKVKVSYLNWSEEITINNEEIRKRMKNN